MRPPLASLNTRPSKRRSIRLQTVTYEIAVINEIADPVENLTGQKIRG
jgi:hypothetical protein